jgi:hypothetical protein
LNHACSSSRAHAPARSRTAAGPTAGRRAALLAGEEFRPRLQRRRINRIGARAHLQHDGVQVQRLRAVENGEGFGLLLGHAQIIPARPVDIGDGGHPGGAEFARRRRRLVGIDGDGRSDRLASAQRTAGDCGCGCEAPWHRRTGDGATGVLEQPSSSAERPAARGRQSQPLLRIKNQNHSPNQ